MESASCRQEPAPALPRRLHGTEPGWGPCVAWPGRGATSLLSCRPCTAPSSAQAQPRGLTIREAGAKGPRWLFPAPSGTLDGEPGEPQACAVGQGSWGATTTPTAQGPGSPGLVPSGSSSSQPAPEHGLERQPGGVSRGPGHGQRQPVPTAAGPPGETPAGCVGWEGTGLSARSPGCQAQLCHWLRGLGPVSHCASVSPRKG